MRLDRNPITSPILGSPNNGVATNGSIKLESSEIYGNGVSAARNGTAVKLEGGTGGAAAGKAFRGEYFGHDRAEVTRILIQGLLDLGYNQAAATLETESEYTLENSYVSSFRQAVLEGQWRQAEILLCSMEINQDVDCNVSLPEEGWLEDRGQRLTGCCRKCCSIFGNRSFWSFSSRGTYRVRFGCFGWSSHRLIIALTHCISCRGRLAAL